MERVHSTTGGREGGKRSAPPQATMTPEPKCEVKIQSQIIEPAGRAALAPFPTACT